jgi:hypothetical protein
MTPLATPAKSSATADVSPHPTTGFSYATVSESVYDLQHRPQNQNHYQNQSPRRNQFLNGTTREDVLGQWCVDPARETSTATITTLKLTRANCSNMGDAVQPLITGSYVEIAKKFVPKRSLLLLLN